MTLKPDDREDLARNLSIPEHHTTWPILTDAEKDRFYMQADCALAWFKARTLPLDGDVVERVAKIIDPDAWNKKLPQDGLGLYWTGRREKAREKAEAAGELLALLKRVTDAADNLASELTDPGTEALAAIYCARAALSSIRDR